MKIGIAGTGAVGGYFGALLKRAGNEVIFLARGKNLERMKEKGLTVESEVETLTVEGIFTDNYEKFTDIDLLLFCVKSTDTVKVAEQFSPFLKPTCFIMTLQNGVDNEEILSQFFGQERVLSAATYIQAMVSDTGMVKQIGVPPRLVIGALDSHLSEKVNDITAVFNAANIITYPSSNILNIKWKKLFWNVTFNPLTALMEVKVGAIYDDEGLYQTALSICKEAIAVANAVGMDIEEDFYETIFAQGNLAREHHPSMLQDKWNGKALEIESICGFIVKKGREVKVDTPVLETIYHLLTYQTKN
ncbi:2-dehydropantoate 2-reductase [Bacillus sp. SORGH_AS 510]|uniref:ketopantoate reductase family protein n=1 Tax=Bacillus sp. SORGH_AS_0510 TaxID=3041771 RepID=UPI00278B0EAC|nr:2-dehydropantoate 2-reductase [Bacillus sp. SORGH_AS_0510]MDQ1146346.1 2-dehydropantoate 2-reductase [Bacillus sp. SORGH_AS_0510]